MRRVQQEHPMGCGIACVAMVTGRAYQDIAKLLPYPTAVKGAGYHVVFELLNRHDLSYQMRFATDTLTNKPREEWPPKEPFAEAHIVCVESPIGGHYVVWLKDGRVLDPNRDGVFRLSDFGRVQHIIGTCLAESSVQEEGK